MSKEDKLQASHHKHNGQMVCLDLIELWSIIFLSEDNNEQVCKYSV